LNSGKKNQSVKKAKILKKEDTSKINILNDNFYTRLIVETEEVQKVAEVTSTDATPA